MHSDIPLYGEINIAISHKFLTTEYNHHMHDSGGTAITHSVRRNVLRNGEGRYGSKKGKRLDAEAFDLELRNFDWEHLRL